MFKNLKLRNKKCQFSSTVSFNENRVNCMMIVKDEIETFIPKEKIRYVILGTMGSVIARNVNGRAPINPFFYHSTRNHFWKILQLIFEPNQTPHSFSVEEKMDFLNQWGIAMSNIVLEISVNDEDQDNSSDQVLFNANRHGYLKFKPISTEL